jgi:hypothetical protein
LVDFFDSAPKHVKDGWTKLLNLDVMSSGADQGSVKKSSKQLQELAKNVVPLDLEVDLKVLYTAVTRCRNRLVLCETNSSAQWFKFVKLYNSKVRLACDHSLPEVADGGNAELLMPDELIDLGLKFIERFDIRGNINSITYI